MAANNSLPCNTIYAVGVFDSESEASQVQYCRYLSLYSSNKIVTAGVMEISTVWVCGTGSLLQRSDKVTQNITLNCFTPKLSQLKPKMYPRIVSAWGRAESHAYTSLRCQQHRRPLRRWKLCVSCLERPGAYFHSSKERDFLTRVMRMSLQPPKRYSLPLTQVLRLHPLK